VRKIVGAQRELTGRFLALVSHYLFEPDFTRIGEGHDKHIAGTKPPFFPFLGGNEDLTGDDHNISSTQ